MFNIKMSNVGHDLSLAVNLFDEFSLVFKLSNDILFLGDLEKLNMGVILKNIKECDINYKVLITHHHGPDWNDNLYKFRFKHAISSNKYFNVKNTCFYEDINIKNCYYEKCFFCKKYCILRKYL